MQNLLLETGALPIPRFLIVVSQKVDFLSLCLSQSVFLDNCLRLALNQKFEAGKNCETKVQFIKHQDAGWKKRQLILAKDVFFGGGRGLINALILILVNTGSGLQVAGVKHKTIPCSENSH